MHIFIKHTFIYGTIYKMYFIQKYLLKLVKKNYLKLTETDYKSLTVPFTFFLL